MKKEKSPIAKYIFIGAFLIVGYFVVGAAKEESAKETPRIPEVEEISHKSGDIMPAADYILGGVTKDDYKDVSEAQRIKDKLGVMELLKQGKAVPIEKGEKIMLINPGFASNLYEVRVQEGSQAGRSCYIPREFFTGIFK